MGFNADDLKNQNWPMAALENGTWVLSRPLDGPFISRLKDAWNVLRNKADALYWTGQ